ncbi:MAG TPA: alpha-galactosidase [Candidatus Limnocylindrales bacterium]
MPITFDTTSRTFHLRNDKISYLLRVLENGTLGHLYFGGALAESGSYGRLSGAEYLGLSNRLGEPVPLECPTPGTGDFRVTSLAVEQPNGSTALDPRYTSHRVFGGKSAIPGLPSTYVQGYDEAETLEILLTDTPASLEMRLFLALYADRPVITRSIRLRNIGSEPLTVQCAMSASLDLPDSDWDMVHLSGAWARERHVRTRHLQPGSQAIGSLRGASGHEHNPFLALKREHTTEDAGEVYGVSLVYSGNFLAEVEVDQFQTTRVRIGINPEGFSWALEPGAEFCTPEAVLAYSETGLGSLSEAYHDLYRDRLARGVWRDAPRPIVLNNWEATYFDFDEARLLEIATSARDLGVEMFVLDDGWFGRRDSDASSLGDWTANKAKLPGGVEGIARQIEALGLRFGIWIEPEMVSPRSQLFADHPDWAVGVPTRPHTEGRNQLVLDMSRREVVDHLFGVLSELLGRAPISYVKWDMNRNITEPFSSSLPAARQGEFFHRYILGVYDLYERLGRAFPQVLFESCASGGGRFDPGMLQFAPQAWTSDNTDAIERLRIQWGTSLCYPLSSMAAHVSAVPNHQTGRSTPLATRAAVAFFGVLGYELDPVVLTEDERATVAGQIDYYKARRELFQRGRLVRLISPFEGDGNETAWMTVSGDAARAVVGHYRVLNGPQRGPARLRLRGLDPSAAYRVSVWPDGDDPVAAANSGVRGGDELMRIGLLVAPENPADSRSDGDFAARLFDLVAEAPAASDRK